MKHFLWKLDIYAVIWNFRVVQDVQEEVNSLSMPVEYYFWSAVFDIIDVLCHRYFFLRIWIKLGILSYINSFTSYLYTINS